MKAVAKRIEIKVPYEYTPRFYQLPFWEAFDSGQFTRFILLWHRRSGKDRTILNLMAREMQRKVGTYYYFFPTYAQGRKAIWEGISKEEKDAQGNVLKPAFRYIKHFPDILVDSVHDTDMKIRYKNGSLFQILGIENIDRIVGTNPIGCAFSEYPLQAPAGWDFIRPILVENGGWAVFDYTPRGKNHGYTLYNKALEVNEKFTAEGKNPYWYVSRLTIEDTKVILPHQIDMERAEGVPEEHIQQEYYTSFTAAIHGAYYVDVYDKAEKEGRFTNVPYDPFVPVHTVWDLGASDTMAIGFYQVVGKELHMIDYVEGGGKGFPYFFKVLQDKGYIYGKHFAPHDVRATEMGTGKTRIETARELGVYFELVPDIGVQDGIDAARMLFNRLWVDRTKCARWLELIPQYTKEWDEDLKIFKSRPLHNWTSHGADQWRYTAVIFDKMTSEIRKSFVHKPKWIAFNRR